MDQATQDQAPALTDPGRGLARAYHRRPDVEAEIRALPSPADPVGFAAAATAAATPETLVYAIRQLLRQGATCYTERLFEQLILKATPIFTNYAQRCFPSSVEDRAEVIQRASIQMWKEVFDLRPTQEFWEVFFNRMVQFTCFAAADPMRRAQSHERPFRTGYMANGDRWSEEDLVPAPPPPVDLDRMLVLQLSARLPDRVQQVVLLRLQGLPQVSQDPTVPTISQILGISDRTVRTYLRQGEHQIREWLAQSITPPTS